MASDFSSSGLPELRARLTEATLALLAEVDSPQIEFLAAYSAFMAASSALSLTLLAAVPRVSLELGEAYLQEGNALPSYAVFLLHALVEFRKRRGVE